MRERRTPRAPRVTTAALERAAVHHLQRYPSSRQQLRRVLMRRLQRAERRSEPGEGPDRDQVVADIDELVEQLSARGHLDDGRLADALAADWLRRGVSPPMIRARLRSKGISGEIATEAITAAKEAAREQGVDPEVASAAAYARRRRLGPFRRNPDERQERRQKDLAALGRRGFRFDVARTVIDADSPDELPEPLL
ncbi:MAG: RecX family transcriptional regulator [Deltaproteobacteria bacterium]|nr:RecX family transcriptional regulator [Deltaproteobacteria bacterium]